MTSDYSGFFSAAFFLTGLAGLALPKDPLNVFPFLVFLSPLPIKNILIQFLVVPQKCDFLR